MSKKKHVICASVILYKQKNTITQPLLDDISAQVDFLLLFDNNNIERTTLSLPSNAFYFPQYENKGISEPHNKAFAWAKDRSCTHVITFDQDSTIPPGLVQNLLTHSNELELLGHPVACVGPAFSDPRTNQTAPFIKLEGWKIKRNSCLATDPPCESEYLITSGCLIPLKSFEKVGPFDESFFIDYVDIEWGLRARSKGLASFGICRTTMQHPIGDRPLLIPIIKKPIPLHSPLRHYYHFRNAISLYKRNYISFPWMANDAIRLLAKFFVYSTLPPNRLNHCRMIVKGVWHGITNQTGRLDNYS